MSMEIAEPIVKAIGCTALVFWILFLALYLGGFGDGPDQPA